MFGKVSTLKHNYLKKSGVFTQKQDERIQKAKEYPLNDLFSGNLKKTGKILMGNCPFHNDPTPSFAIYPETNTYTCFGCHKSGDVISFYMKLNSVDFQTALEALAG